MVADTSFATVVAYKKYFPNRLHSNFSRVLSRNSELLAQQMMESSWSVGTRSSQSNYNTYQTMKHMDSYSLSQSCHPHHGFCCNYRYNFYYVICWSCYEDFNTNYPGELLEPLLTFGGGSVQSELSLTDKFISDVLSYWLCCWATSD